MLKVGMKSIEIPEVARKYSQEFVVDKQIAQAMDSQTEIGWDNFLFGRISVH